MLTLACDQCGVSFERYPSKVRGTRQFCGHLCRVTWQRQHPEEARSFALVQWQSRPRSTMTLAERSVRRRAAVRRHRERHLEAERARQRLSMRRHRAADLEGTRAKAREYYSENRDRLLPLMREWRNRSYWRDIEASRRRTRNSQRIRRRLRLRLVFGGVPVA
jgi:hypothetical protein